MVANRMNPFLDKSLSFEQFGFLKSRNILEAVGITQEVLHTIKTENLGSLVLNIDLIKYFDRVN